MPSFTKEPMPPIFLRKYALVCLDVGFCAQMLPMKDGFRSVFGASGDVRNGADGTGGFRSSGWFLADKYPFKKI